MIGAAVQVRAAPASDRAGVQLLTQHGFDGISPERHNRTLAAVAHHEDRWYRGLMTTHDAHDPSTAHLTLIPEAALEALLAGSLETASEIMGLALPDVYLTKSWLWRYRLDQIRADPDSAPWLVRAVYSRPAEAVVGHAGFHGPPDAVGMVEIGYAIVPEFRRRGYARAAVGQLMAYAAAHGARVVRASVSPENVASLALIRSYGFQHVGEQWDEKDGRELIFERLAG